MTTLTIRGGETTDFDCLGQLFHRAVRQGARHKYSADQVAAWSPDPPSGQTWHDRLATGEVFVALEDDTHVGFMTLVTNAALLDFAYVLPDRMGAGIAASLYAVLECRARSLKLPALSTDASDLARPFFLKQDWQVEKRQMLVRRGVTLHNWRMTKTLNPV